jgi:archaemetzincin
MKRRSVRFILLYEEDPVIVAGVTSLAETVLKMETAIRMNVRCEAGFDPARRQWRADATLERCVVPYASADSYAVGLTWKDLYVPSLNFVFGLAAEEIGAAIVSSHRLKEEDAEIVVARIAKETIHEVGHLEGMAHCTNERCVMWFSNTLAETDRKKAEFCSKCSARLFS